MFNSAHHDSERLASEEPGTISVGVNAKTLVTHGNLSISGIAAAPARPWMEIQRRRAARVALTLLLATLTSHFWPSAEALPVELDLRSTYLRFRLASAQAALFQLPVGALTAQGLERAIVPTADSEYEVSIVSPQGARDLRLQVESLAGARARAGSLTLQSETLVPQALVELSAENSDRYALRIGQQSKPLSISVSGEFRYRPLWANRRPEPWRQEAIPAPRRVDLFPQNQQLTLDLQSPQLAQGKAAEDIPVDGLWLHFTEATHQASQTLLQDRFEIEEGQLKVGRLSPSQALPSGSRLYLANSRGRISDLRWSDGSFQFRFTGTAARISLGSDDATKSVLPWGTVARHLIARTSAYLCAAALLLALSLHSPLLVRRLRARWASVH